MSAGTMVLYQQEINRLNELLEEKMLECDRLSREREDHLLRNKEHIQMLEEQVIRKTCSLHIALLSFHSMEAYAQVIIIILLYLHYLTH